MTARTAQTIAQGFNTPRGKKQIVVYLEPATFAELRARAVHKQQSLNSYMCELMDGSLHRLDGK